ncbi:pyruvate formate-lyase-activating protein [Streptobacillus felis]|uniref:Pyruvate formate-lyase-activating enzyme n=1 Tax=Streptobacillus felis TaxID=1384509 RepID=A0A7Z0PFD5_9FUSO|nr:pyruvate formate-lyase-activating protein [Streptobacillus felis]NYV27723.1 pyruvate formate lyase-activating protein [Streptobacillus felis]
MEKKNIGYIYSFESFGTKDGPGIRFVLFLQGCPLRCLYCHNVDTWNLKDYQKVMTPEEVFKEIMKVKGFIKTGGVTVSGGEPLVQSDFIIELFKLCKEVGIHTCIDTSGYIFTEKAKQAIELADLVMLDIKHIDQEKYKTLTAVNLAPTLKMADYLESINKPVWLRYVLVPGYSDDPKDLEDWAKYCSKFKNVERVDILPFHQMGTPKWDKMKKEYKLRETPTPTKEEIKMAEEIFMKYELPLYKVK